MAHDPHAPDSSSAIASHQFEVDRVSLTVLIAVPRSRVRFARGTQ